MTIDLKKFIESLRKTPEAATELRKILKISDDFAVIAEIMQQMRTDFNERTNQIAARTDQLASQMEQMRTDFKSEMQQMRTDFKSEMQQMRTDFNERTDQIAARTDQLASQMEQMRTDFNERTNQIAARTDQVAARTDQLASQMEQMRTDFNKRTDQIAARTDQLASQITNLREEMDMRFEGMNQQIIKLGHASGGSFESFMRSVIQGKLLSDGRIPSEKLLTSITLRDPDHIVNKDTDTAEIDIFCDDPLIVGEITEYIMNIKELDKLLRRVKLVEQVYGRKVKYIMLVAKGMALEERSKIMEKAKRNNVELVTV